LTLPPNERLAAHLTAWLGAWPLPVDEGVGTVTGETEVIVVGSRARTQPGWDGTVHALVGVVSPAGGVLSVAPDVVDAVLALAGRPNATAVTVGALERGLSAVVGRPHGHPGRGLFRWSVQPTALPDAGEWVPTSDPRVPPWLKPFNGDVLVAWDEARRYGAGVGRKVHDAFGHELAVGTEEALRGHGIARRLVAQAARRVLDDGAVPTYLHAPDNVASARVADASGFPDRGWRVLGVWDA
jgi:GNAT superfamily N-acetyltransferase